MFFFVQVVSGLRPGTVNQDNTLYFFEFGLGKVTNLSRLVPREHQSDLRLVFFPGWYLGGLQVLDICWGDKLSRDNA